MLFCIYISDTLMNTMEETELIKRCRDNDRLAQELLFAKHSDRLFRTAARFVKDQAIAEDVLIVGFNRIFSSLEAFVHKGSGSLEAWMRKIVVNEALMALRKRHNFHLTESLDPNLHEPELEELAELDGEEIYAAITALPTGYRTVFNLAVVEGYSHEEIAEMLAISAGTSRSQLYKAKSLLKKMLHREGLKYGY